MGAISWNRCLCALEAELPLQQFNTWVRPLHAVELPNGLKLLAPNRFVVDWVKTNLLTRIAELLSAEAANAPVIHVEVGARNETPIPAVAAPVFASSARRGPALVIGGRVQPEYKFSIVRRRQEQPTRQGCGASGGGESWSCT